jgi:hypothetical protein
MGKLFLSLTYFGMSPAWALNFMSTIFGTLTALLLLLTVTQITKEKWLGVLAGGMFAFSPIVWRYAITSEVFAINNFFASAIFYFFFLYLDRRSKQFNLSDFEDKTKIKKEPKSALAATIAFIFGLGLSNHHSVLFTGIPVIAFLIWDNRKNQVNLLKLFCFFALGLTPYLYLFWAGSRNLVTSWGQTNTLAGFLTHILRTEYGTFRLTPYQFDHTYWGDLGKVFYDLVFNELIIVGAVLAGIGIASYRLKLGKKTSVIFSQLCVLSSVSYFLVFFVFNQMPVDLPLKFGVHLRFLQLFLIPISILMGLGANKLFSVIKLNNLQKTNRIGIAFCILLVSLQVALHYQMENQHDNYSSYRYAKAHLKSLPVNAILLLSGDGAYYPINYLQACENFRTDVSVIPRGLMRGPWMPRHIREKFGHITLPNEVNEDFSLKDFLDANYKKFALYIAGYDSAENNQWENTYMTWPTGFTNLIIKRTDSKLNRIQLLKTSNEILGNLDFSDLVRFPRESWENIYFRTFKENYSHLGMFLAVLAKDDPTHASFYLDLASYYFKEYFTNNPFPAPLAYKQQELIRGERKRALNINALSN